MYAFRGKEKKSRMGKLVFKLLKHLHCGFLVAKVLYIMGYYAFPSTPAYMDIK